MGDSYQFPRVCPLRTVKGMNGGNAPQYTWWGGGSSPLARWDLGSETSTRERVFNVSQ